MSFDFNVDNYTNEELLVILELENPPLEKEIIESTNVYIMKFKTENNPKMVAFFTEIQQKLLEEYNHPEKKFESDITDKILPDKNPRSKNDSGNSFTVAVKQDKLNPNLENTTSRLIHIDSLYRQSSGNDSSTDFTLDLSDPLINVLSLRLYSIQIPFSWYTIDTQYKNTDFWITDVSANINYRVSVDSGNYTPTNFADHLNSKLCAITADPSGNYVSYNVSTGKITINLTGSNLGNSNNYFTFFDFSGNLDTSPTVNGTLGWLMGFRDATQQVNLNGGNVASCIIDLYGTKNLILIVDDFNQNHVNNSLISITETSKVLSLPTYYRPDLPFTAMPPTSVTNNNLTDFGEGSYITNRTIPIMKPSEPRILTQAQIYTINEIMKNREKTMNYRIRAPTSPDIFAMIPMKHTGMKLGDFYIEFGSSLQVNKRVYFGPVNIERLRIKLQDDKGNTINLNGVEWSVTFISENLYQY
jgi:hypothetical protein